MTYRRSGVAAARLAKAWHMANMAAWWKAAMAPMKNSSSYGGAAQLAASSLKASLAGSWRASISASAWRQLS